MPRPVSMAGRDRRRGTCPGSRRGEAGGERAGFDGRRAFRVIFGRKRKFIPSYDNGGTAMVTRFEDVKEVLARDGEFEVVYGPRMIEITGGQNFFLGTQDTA